MKHLIILHITCPKFSNAINISKTDRKPYVQNTTNIKNVQQKQTFLKK